MEDALIATCTSVHVQMQDTPNREEISCILPASMYYTVLSPKFPSSNKHWWIPVVLNYSTLSLFSSLLPLISCQFHRTPSQKKSLNGANWQNRTPWKACMVNKQNDKMGLWMLRAASDQWLCDSAWRYETERNQFSCILVWLGGCNHRRAGNWWSGERERCDVLGCVWKRERQWKCMHACKSERVSVWASCACVYSTWEPCQQLAL